MQNKHLTRTERNIILEYYGYVTQKQKQQACKETRRGIQRYRGTEKYISHLEREMSNRGLYLRADWLSRDIEEIRKRVRLAEEGPTSNLGNCKHAPENESEEVDAS
jgi:hypothetical protein